ncbi:MAG: DJ-1/PfpI family protein, partial [Clostridia bacterium]|nr:DJ-1/PfpI family protein [Clostridia bacterium]
VHVGALQLGNGGIGGLVLDIIDDQAGVQNLIALCLHKGTHGIDIKADKTINDISLPCDGLELIMLPGGMPGTTNLYDCEALRKAVTLAANKGIAIAAICAAPMILGRLGLLKNKTAVCYPGFEDELTGAKIPKRAKVAVSENIITAAGMGVATEFGLAIVEKIRSKETAEKIAKAIRFK